MAKKSPEQQFTNRVAKIRKNRAREFVLAHGISPTQKDQIVHALEGGNTSLGKLHLSYRGMGDERVARMAIALRGHPNLYDLSFTNNDMEVNAAEAVGELLQHADCQIKTLALGRNPKIGDDGMRFIANGLRHNSRVQVLDVADTGISDTGALYLADTMQHLEGLREVNVGSNEIGARGALAIAAGAAAIPTMAKITMGKNAVDAATVAAMGEAFLHAQHRNILEIASDHSMSSEMKDLCAWNRRAALDNFLLLDQMASVEMNDPATWWQIAERLPAMYSIVTKPSERFNKLNRFRDFINGLPEVDFTQPITLEGLMTEQERFAPIDNPKTWFEWERVVQGLNANGHQFRQAELVTEEGSITPFCKSVIDHDQTASLFTYENWEGATRSELQATLRALPEEAFEAIPNRQQLLAALGSDERTLTRAQIR